MAIDHVEIIPEDKWCYTIKDFRGSYDGNKVYLGRSNNLNRHVYVTLTFVCKNLAEQKEFFDWWENSTDRGGRPFYMKLPLYGLEKYYLLVQNKPFTQSIDKGFKITASFMVYDNKTKDEIVAPVTKDVSATVEGASQNNVILLDIVDPDYSGIISVEMVGSDTGVIVKGESISYTPPSGFLGTKTFQYKAFDGVLWSNTSTITIDIIDIDKPIAYLTTVHVMEAGNGNTDRMVGLSAIDPKNRLLTYSITVPVTGVSIPDTHIGQAKVVLTAGNTSPIDIIFRVDNALHHDGSTTKVIIDTLPPLQGIIDFNLPSSDGSVIACKGGANEQHYILPKTDNYNNTLTYTTSTSGGSDIHASVTDGNILKIITDNGAAQSTIIDITANNGASTANTGMVLFPIDVNNIAPKVENGSYVTTTDGTAGIIKVPVIFDTDKSVTIDGSKVGTYSIVSDPDSLVTINANEINVGILATGESKTAILKITSCDGIKSNDFSLTVSKA